MNGDVASYTVTPVFPCRQTGMHIAFFFFSLAGPARRIWGQPGEFVLPCQVQAHRAQQEDRLPDSPSWSSSVLDIDGPSLYLSGTFASHRGSLDYSHQRQCAHLRGIRALNPATDLHAPPDPSLCSPVRREDHRIHVRLTLWLAEQLCLASARLTGHEGCTTRRSRELIAPRGGRHLGDPG